MRDQEQQHPEVRQYDPTPAASLEEAPPAFQPDFSAATTAQPAEVSSPEELFADLSPREDPLGEADHSAADDGTAASGAKETEHVKSVRPARDTASCAGCASLKAEAEANQQDAAEKVVKLTAQLHESESRHKDEIAEVKQAH